MNRFLIAAASFAFASSAIADATPSPSEVLKLNEALATLGVRLQMLWDNFGRWWTEALARSGLQFKRLSTDAAIVVA